MFLCDIKYSWSDIFQESILNDKNFMSTVTILSYDYILSVESLIMEKKNLKIQGKLDLLDMETKNLADL